MFKWFWTIFSLGAPVLLQCHPGLGPLWSQSLFSIIVRLFWQARTFFERRFFFDCMNLTQYADWTQVAHCGIHSQWIPCSCDNWCSVIRVAEVEKDVFPGTVGGGGGGDSRIKVTGMLVVSLWGVSWGPCVRKLFTGLIMYLPSQNKEHCIVLYCIVIQGGQKVLK